MKKPRAVEEAPPESDRFGEAPHPRDTYGLIGHEAAEQEFLSAYRENRLPQSWIIGGREGIGKATLAWRVARFLFAHPDPKSPAVQAAKDLAVGRDHPVAHRIEALSHGDLFLLRREWNTKAKPPRHFTEIRVDDVRRALGLFHHAAAEGGWRVCIIDPADDLNRNAANAMLKLIEEPPPRCLFLFVSHRPGQIIPTIRSRSRMLHLEPLSDENVLSVLRTLDDVWSDHDERAITEAARKAGGSVRDALRLLTGSGLALTGRIEALVSRLPQVDWVKVHELADGLTSRDKTEDFEAALAGIYDWIDRRVHERAASGAVADLARYAQVWEKIATAARETEALNLDRRPLILSIFSNLSEAAGH